VAGGVTTVLEHPLSVPPVSTPEAFELKLRVARAKSIADFGLWGALLPESIPNMSALVDLGVVGFKGFMSAAGADYPMLNDEALMAGFVEAARLDAIVAVHAESEGLARYFAASATDADKASPRSISTYRPPIVEFEAASRAILLAEAAGCRLHLVHTSLAAVATLAAGARARGVRVTTETCGHYLHFDETALDVHGSLAKCKPPLRDAAEVARLWRAVLDGHVDFMASDHAPYSLEEKATEIWDAPWGMPGAQTLVPILISDGLLARNWNPSAFARFVSTNAARTFGLYPKKGTIRVGSDADLMVVDPAAKWQITEDDLYSKQSWSPLVGEELMGRIVMTILRGVPVFVNGNVAAGVRSGDFVRPSQGELSAGPHQR
jgi:allantoinase